MPRRIPMGEYALGILRLQENPHVLSWLTDMRFFMEMPFLYDF